MSIERQDKLPLLINIDSNIQIKRRDSIKILKNTKNLNPNLNPYKVIIDLETPSFNLSPTLNSNSPKYLDFYELVILVDVANKENR